MALVFLAITVCVSVLECTRLLDIPQVSAFFEGLDRSETLYKDPARARDLPTPLYDKSSRDRDTSHGLFTLTNLVGGIGMGVILALNGVLVYFIGRTISRVGRQVQTRRKRWDRDREGEE